MVDLESDAAPASADRGEPLSSSAPAEETHQETVDPVGDKKNGTDSQVQQLHQSLPSPPEDAAATTITTATTTTIAAAAICTTVKTPTEPPVEGRIGPCGGGAPYVPDSGAGAADSTDDPPPLVVTASPSVVGETNQTQQQPPPIISNLNSDDGVLPESRSSNAAVNLSTGIRQSTLKTGREGDVQQAPPPPPQRAPPPPPSSAPAAPVVEDPLGPLDEDFKFFVANLPLSATAADIRKHFEAYGRVNYVKLIYNRTKGASCGYGFVYMLTAEGDAAVWRYAQESHYRIQLMGQSGVYLQRNDQRRVKPLRNRPSHEEGKLVIPPSRGVGGQVIGGSNDGLGGLHVQPFGPARGDLGGPAFAAGRVPPRESGPMQGRGPYPGRGLSLPMGSPPIGMMQGRVGPRDPGTVGPARAPFHLPPPAHPQMYGSVPAFQQQPEQTPPVVGAMNPHSYFSHDVAPRGFGDFKHEGGYSSFGGAADRGSEQGAFADGAAYNMGYASDGGGYYSDAHEQSAAFSSQHSDFSQGSSGGYLYGQAALPSGDSYSYGLTSQAGTAVYQQPERLQQQQAVQQYSGYDPSAAFCDGSYPSQTAGQELFHQGTSDAPYGGFFRNVSFRDYSNVLGSSDASYSHSAFPSYSNENGAQQHGLFSAPQQLVQLFPERDPVGYSQSSLPSASRVVGGRPTRGGGGRGGRGVPHFQQRHGGNPY